MTNEAPIEWINRDPSRIEDIDKAAHMAAVENMWRRSINYLLSDDFTPAEQRMARQSAHLQAELFGPQAVEKAGKDYDAFQTAVIPPFFGDALSDPHYATGRIGKVE